MSSGEGLGWWGRTPRPRTTPHAVRNHHVIVIRNNIHDNIFLEPVGIIESSRVQMRTIGHGGNGPGREGHIVVGGGALLVDVVGRVGRRYVPPVHQHLVGLRVQGLVVAAVVVREPRYKH